MRIRSRATVVAIIILTLSMGLVGPQMDLGIAQGQTSALYPIVVALDDVDTVFIAAHTSSKVDGNWIELSGGTSVTLPSVTLIYEGLSAASYTRDGVTVDIDSSFDQGQATYPIPIHQVYSPLQPISAEFWGATAFQGESVDFKLLKLTSLTEVRDIFTEAFQGNLAPLQGKLDGAWSTTEILDVDGDATADIPAQTVGDYLLVVIREETGPYKLYIYSATAIEVIDYTLQVSAPSPVKKGDNVNINLELSSPAPPSIYIYGAVMVKKTAYFADIKLSTDGTIINTAIHLNDKPIGNGALASEFILGTMDLSDLFDYALELMAAFESSEITFGYGLTLSSTTGFMSLSTSFLDTGDYILLVGVFKDLGSRIVGVYQTAVTVISPGLPVANADGPYSGKPGAAITFDGSGSYDIDGYIVSYVWTFGDGGTGTGVSPSHTYTADGAYTVILTVTDEASQTAFHITTATISTPSPPPPPPPPPITNKPPVAEAGPNQMAYVGDVIHFSGAGSYDPDGTILFYDWDFGDGTMASGINVSHAYSEPGIYTANLTVMDDRIADGSDTCTITVLEIIPLPPIPPILSNLIVTPSELDRGDNVTISLDIENIDNQSFTYIVTMHIENVNEPPSTWPPYGVTLLVDVELGAYEAKTVSRTITMDTVGDFNVTVDGLTGSFTVETPEIPLKPAEFVVSYLYIKPEKIELGEGIDVCTFKISVDVTNVGERTGSHTVELKVDGKVVESRTVILIGGKETSIVFDVTRGVGSYAVEVDGLTGSFLVKPYLRPMKPAEFEVSDLVLTPSEAQPGATIIVSAKIANIGEMEGNYTLELKLDGETVETESVTLAGGTSQEISFTISSEEEGTHTVEVYELSDSFTVKLPPPKKPIWPLIVIAAAIIAVLIYIIWIKTDWIQQLIERMGIDGDVHQELP